MGSYRGKYKKGDFWYFNCRCLKCGHTQYIRKYQLLLNRRKCDNCKYKEKSIKSEHKLQKENIKRNQPFVTKQANISKHVMSMQELYNFCLKVVNHANQQPSQPLTKLEGSETNN